MERVYLESLGPNIFISLTTVANWSWLIVFFLFRRLSWFRFFLNMYNFGRFIRGLSFSFLLLLLFRLPSLFFGLFFSLLLFFLFGFRGLIEFKILSAAIDNSLFSLFLIGKEISISP